MWRWVQRNLSSNEQNSSTAFEKVPTENSEVTGSDTSLLNRGEQKQRRVSNNSTIQRRGGKFSQKKEQPLKEDIKECKSMMTPEQAATMIQKNWKAYQARNLVAGLRKLLEEETKTLSLTGKGGSHDMEALFAELEVAKALCDVERLEKVSKKCAELQETLTQRTIAVDGIPHGQNDIVRQQRKNTVKTILSLADKADNMKEQVESALDSIRD
ncbi:hypothetical protein GpartN1_g5786.t1 [Galdieria partita]|uniref:BAG domain-containing protein n=1 Tax=Galdieria partita TaxID=83374 RepID=A0A9C7Q169_9RHOD|nr:hypothetical protein GpartN1_g5786.t1 [Galdieria partita]